MVIDYFDASATARDDQPYCNTYTWYVRVQGKVIAEAVAFFDCIALDELRAKAEPV